MTRITRPLALVVSNQRNGFRIRKRGETLGREAISPAGLGVRERGRVRTPIIRPVGSPIAIAHASKLTADVPRFAQTQTRSLGQGRVGRRPTKYF